MVRDVTPQFEELMKVCLTCAWLGFVDDYEKHMPRTPQFPGYVQPSCCVPGEIPIHVIFRAGILWDEKTGRWEFADEDNPCPCPKYKKSTRTKLDVPPEPVFKCCKCGKILNDGDPRYNRPAGTVCMDCT